MSKHLEKINELGGIEKFPKTIKALVRDYKNAEKYLKEQKANLENASEEDVEAIQKEIEETESALEEGDEEILRKIDIYWKNREVYQRTTQKMREKRDAARVERGEEPIGVNAKSEPIPAPQAAPQPAPVVTAPATEAVITKSGGGETQILTDNPIVEEKKAEGFGSLILWGALGFAGILIGVNLFKNRN
jgi:hypothetical protein